MLKIYEAVIEPDEIGFSVQFPDIPGCSTQGDDMQEACEMASDVLGLMLQTMRETGREWPEPTYGRGSDGERRIVAFAVAIDDDCSRDCVTVNEATRDKDDVIA